MFLPAVPAYLWLWPNIKGTSNLIAQIITYIYVLVWTLYIGRRRWDWSQLGLNCRGLRLSLACGFLMLTMRLLIILAINWLIVPLTLTPMRLFGELLFYFGLVGLCE